MKTFIIALGFAVAASSAFAGEETIKLKDAPGRDVVEGNCAACHSLDYIIMNSPFQKPEGWQATVGKMIKSYGAPVDEASAKTIVDYLAKNYGQP